MCVCVCVCVCVRACVRVYVFVCVYIRGETIRVNAILRIVFECIAIYCHIAIFDRILILYENVGFGSKEKNIHPV